MEELNLSYMTRMQSLWPKARIGYSSHAPYFAYSEVAAAAVALGAQAYEFHFDLDATPTSGPDVAVSICEDAAQRMIERMRSIEIARGDGIKRLQPGELQTMALLDARR
jgi:sialic acid synthase SpsE